MEPLPLCPCSSSEGPVLGAVPADGGEAGELGGAAVPGAVEPGAGAVDGQRQRADRGVSVPPAGGGRPADLQHGPRGPGPVRVLVPGVGRRQELHPAGHRLRARPVSGQEAPRARPLRPAHLHRGSPPRRAHRR